MPDLGNINFIILFQITGLLAIFAIGVVLLIDHFRQNKNLRTDVENQQEQIAEMFKIVQYLKQATDDLEQDNKELRKEMDLRGLYDGATDTHLQAINAARAGATAENIAENYNLIAAEAELIVSMHGKGSQQRKH